MSSSPRARSLRLPLLCGALVVGLQVATEASGSSSAAASIPLPLAPRPQEEVPTAAGELPPTPDPLTEREWSRLVDWLTPPEEELEWLEIGWAPTLAEGVRRASQEGRPLLLWAMNGHPLGCT